MKDLKQIREYVAMKQGFYSWEHLKQAGNALEVAIDKIAKWYAKELLSYAKDTQFGLMNQIISEL